MGISIFLNDIPNIRINSGSGITLFEVSNNINEWSQINILPNDAKQLRNSNTIGTMVLSLMKMEILIQIR